MIIAIHTRLRLALASWAHALLQVEDVRAFRRRRKSRTAFMYHRGLTRFAV
jgi:hypothetical protein